MIVLSLLLLITNCNYEEIAKKIYRNECSCREENLVVWSEGEEFLSLGIGHFIWFPKGAKAPFREQFPEFVDFARVKGAQIPAWIERYPPWERREEFIQEGLSKRILSLRSFLKETFSLQSEFISHKIENVLPMLVTNLNEQEKKHVTTNFQRLHATSKGLYALMDYLNFKGDGTSENERYQGEGWGLLQVLQKMPEGGNSAIEEFVNAAKSLLIKRVQNSPSERNEAKWLLGWLARINTYLE